MQRTHLAAVVAGLTLIVAACGDDAADTASSTPTVDATEEMTTDATEDESTTESTDTTDTAPESTTPESTTVDSTTPDSTTPDSTTVDTSEPATDAAVPQAIVSLSPTATEMLYAIGADDQVLAVDDLSNFPPEAADKMQGISAFEPSVEAIAGLEPDLVVTDGTNAELLSQLDSLGIEHWEGPAATSFDDVYTQIEQLGAVTGRMGDAAELVAQMQADVDDVMADLPGLPAPLSYYHELDETYYSVTSDTFIGAVYDEVGLVNIADQAGVDSPYPQLNAEYIIESDPDLIFLACTVYCGTTAESVGERPGWDSMTAVQTGGVVEMNDDIASRWGPRIVDYLEAVGEAVERVAEAQPTG